MDLLSSRPGLPLAQGTGLSDLPAAAYHPISIHGTLPRRKRGGNNLALGNYTWDPRANRTQPSVGGNTALAPGHAHPPLTSPLVQNIIDDFYGYREPAAGLDATVDYVKVAENLVQRDGDFLIRDSLSIPGSYVLTCQWRNAAQHFKINKKVVMLNEAYSRVEYRLEREGFDNVPALIRFYVGNRKPVSQVVGAIIFQPVNRGLPLRCLEEKYGLSSTHRDALMAQERRSQKRLSLNITNGHAAHDAAHDGTRCHDNGMSRGNQLRPKDRCGSQPASLNQAQERRRPLKAHQSESFLPLGSKSQQQQPPDPLLSSPKSPVFRTGSEPLLSPSFPRRSAEPPAGQAIRGSDSQLCPRPPPKPSKVPLARLPRSPCLQPLAPAPCASSHHTASSSAFAAPALEPTCAETPSPLWRGGGAPPVPPVKPLKFPHQLDSHCSSTSALSPPETLRYPDPEATGGRTEWPQPSPADLRCCSPPQWEETSPVADDAFGPPPPPSGSHVERLRREGERDGEEAGGRRGLDRSSYHHAIAALENTSEEEEEDARREEDERRRRARGRSGFQRPLVETESMFRPAEFGHHTMAIGVAVDILGCTGSVEERASTLNRIILVAVELKDTVGDLFALTALMKALDLPQLMAVCV
ncbi:hypothetical protein F2P81_005315 [Scophthalmus maximus]|uniref:SH2 domain-containing protein n=1 Tax=Scophthalmus maximus TaxID=52904 RepID=A0A6A4T6X1_SCOMX|nr:hypothetical protein F2P81_005315 [Scophthalmus maximus]